MTPCFPNVLNNIKGSCVPKMFDHCFLTGHLLFQTGRPATNRLDLPGQSGQDDVLVGCLTSLKPVRNQINHMQMIV